MTTTTATTALAERLAAEVRAEMARKQVSLNQLADRAGIPLSTLGRKIHGVAPFTIDEIYTVANVLGVDVVRLIARCCPVRDEQERLS